MKKIKAYILLIWFILSIPIGVLISFKYKFIEENDNFTNFAVVTENCYLENTDSWIIEKNIKSVITHEQIEQMAYKVGE